MSLFAAILQSIKLYNLMIFNRFLIKSIWRFGFVKKRSVELLHSTLSEYAIILDHLRLIRVRRNSIPQEKLSILQEAPDEFPSSVFYMRTVPHFTSFACLLFLQSIPEEATAEGRSRSRRLGCIARFARR